MNNPDNQCYTVREAADRLRVSTKHIEDLVTLSELPEDLNIVLVNDYQRERSLRIAHATWLQQMKEPTAGWMPR